MSTDDRYNGWANRETWAVALHINNHQGWQESTLELVKNTVEGVQQDPPAWLEPEDLTDTYYANTVGDAIKGDVEQRLTVDGWAELTGEDHLPAELSRIAEDIGSLYRVDWRAVGAAFLEQLGEED